MPSQRQSLTILPMATQPTAMATTERGPLMPSQRQSPTMPMATQPTAMAITERGPLMPSQRQSPTMPTATQPMATATTERGPLMPSQRQSLTILPMATQPTAMATTERGPLMPSQRQSPTMPMATQLMVTMFMESKVQSADLEPSMTATLKAFPESILISFHFIFEILILPFLQVTNFKYFLKSLFNVL